MTVKEKLKKDKEVERGEGVKEEVKEVYIGGGGGEGKEVRG